MKSKHISDLIFEIPDSRLKTREISDLRSSFLPFDFCLLTFAFLSFLRRLGSTELYFWAGLLPALGMSSVAGYLWSVVQVAWAGKGGASAPPEARGLFRAYKKPNALFGGAEAPPFLHEQRAADNGSS